MTICKLIAQYPTKREVCLEYMDVKSVADKIINEYKERKEILFISYACIGTEGKGLIKLEDKLNDVYYIVTDDLEFGEYK